MWRRSCTIVMSITTLLHALFQFLGAYLAHEEWQTMAVDAEQSLNMTNVTDRFFWTADDAFVQELLAANATADDGDSISLLATSAGGDPMRCAAFANCPAVPGVLEGTASCGHGAADPVDAPSALEQRLARERAPGPEGLRIMSALTVGERSVQVPARYNWGAELEGMGNLEWGPKQAPLTTEPIDWYETTDTPWGSRERSTSLSGCDVRASF